MHWRLGIEMHGSNYNFFLDISRNISILNMPNRCGSSGSDDRVQV